MAQKGHTHQGAGFPARDHQTFRCLGATCTGFSRALIGLVTASRPCVGLIRPYTMRFAVHRGRTPAHPHLVTVIASLKCAAGVSEPYQAFERAV